MPNSLKIALILLSSILFAGCQAGTLSTYESDKYSFEYQSTYTIEEATESNPFLTVKGENGRLEIFESKDFEDPLNLDGGRSHGYSSSGIDEFEAKLVPKEKLETGDHQVWLFYLEDDEQTKTEVHAIYKSIKTKYLHIYYEGEDYKTVALEGTKIAYIDSDEEVLPLVNDSSEAGHFENKTFGISFEYPKDWIMKETNYRYDRKGRIIWFELSNYELAPGEWPGLHEGELRLNFQYYETDQDLEEFFQENDTFVEANIKQHIEKWSQYIDNSDITVEDYNGMTESLMINGHKFMRSSGQVPKKEEGHPSKHRDYYFEKDGRIFSIAASTITAEGDEALLEMAEELVNTIKFD